MGVFSSFARTRPLFTDSTRARTRLRPSANLAQVHDSLARDLFHAAFVSCWFELAVQPAYQEHLVRCLELAFRSDSIPPEILQILLNLAEFMEHVSKASQVLKVFSAQVFSDVWHQAQAWPRVLTCLYRSAKYRVIEPLALVLFCATCASFGCYFGLM
jgi:hypothetical protein